MSFRAFYQRLLTHRPNSKVMGYFSIFIVFCLLIVIVRMKGIEQDYRIHELNMKIESELFDNKELKAKKAKHLSAESLLKYSRKFSLGEPKQEQVIVIP